LLAVVGGFCATVDRPMSVGAQQQPSLLADATSAAPLLVAWLGLEASRMLCDFLKAVCPSASVTLGTVAAQRD